MSLLTLSLLTLSLLTLSLLTLVSLAFTWSPFSVLLAVSSCLRLTIRRRALTRIALARLPCWVLTSGLPLVRRVLTSLAAAAFLVRTIFIWLCLPRLHSVRWVAPGLPTMIENSLHRLAVIGAVGSHRRSGLLLTTSLLSATTLTVGLPALRIFSRTPFPCGAFPRLIATRLLCRARLAGLLATCSLLTCSLRSIGLFAVRLLPAAALPLPATALSSSARATGFSSLPLRRSLLLVVAGLRLLTTLLAAAGGTALLPGLGFPLLATVLLRGVLLGRFLLGLRLVLLRLVLLRLVLLSLAGLLRLLAAPVAGALFAGCLGLTVRRLLAARGIFPLSVLLSLPIGTLCHALTVCFVWR